MGTGTHPRPHRAVPIAMPGQSCIFNTQLPGVSLQSFMRLPGVGPLRRSISMAVYTCYDMIRDCQAGVDPKNAADGWIYLVDEFVPAIASIAQHYCGGDSARSDAAVRNVVERLRGPASLFQGMAPCHQREFLYQLRPLILDACGRTMAPGSGALDLELVTEALQPLSATERQAAWLETYGYDVAPTAVLMRMAPETVAKLRERVAELLRSKLDSWSAGVLAREGIALGAELETQDVTEPLEFRHFLDVIDGRITWQRKTALERQLESSWPEVHKACRIREADHALTLKAAVDSEPYLALLNVKKPKPARWKSMFARS
jgi:hypothetical protein